MTARAPWLMIGFILGTLANDPGVAQVAHDLGAATRALLGLPQIEAHP